MQKLLRILIGIPKYRQPDISDLPFCAKDVVALRNVLVENLGIAQDEIQCLGTDQSAEIIRTNVLRTIKYASDVAQEENILLFYFSGHGFSSEKEAYLATFDTERDLPKDTAIPIHTIREQFATNKARIKLFILDSCFSGIHAGKNADLMTKEFEHSLETLISEG